MKFTANFLPATVTLASFMTREADATYLSGIVRLFRGDGDTPLQDQAKGMHMSSSVAGLTYPDATPYGEVSRKVFHFNGQTSASGSSEGLPSGKQARTMMGWIKVDSATDTLRNEAILGYGNWSEPNLYAIHYANDQRWELDHFNGGEVTGRHITPIKKWFHVAGTYDGTNAALYKDGAFLQGGADDRIDTLTDSPAITFLGGKSPSENTFKGYIADFAIFDRALSADEIRSVFESNDGLKPELTLEEKYNMTVVPDSVAVAFDENSSGNEISYKLKIAKETAGDLNPITILDYTTCKIPFTNSNIISAKLLGDEQTTTNADDRYNEVPIEIDVNTTMFESTDSPNDYFTTKVDGKNNVQLKFCVMSELGSTTVVDLNDNGKDVTSSISYNKVKFDITIDMENNFAVTDMNIEEKSASTASKDAVIAYELSAYECDDNDDKIENPSNKNQNSMVRICIQTPANNDVVIASIKEFKLKSNLIASNAISGSAKNALTTVSGEGSKTVAVTTQMVSAFFSDLGTDPSTIDVEGTAVMEFKATGQRKLVRLSSNQKNGNVSDMDRKLDGDAGLGEFAMKVGISKSSSEENGAATSGASNALSVAPLMTVTSLALGGVLMGTMF